MVTSARYLRLWWGPARLRTVRAEVEPMVFDPYCPACKARPLLGFHSLRGLDNTPDGIVLVFECPECHGDAVLITGKRIYDEEITPTR
jgi:hypothetical protein